MAGVTRSFRTSRLISGCACSKGRTLFSHALPYSPHTKPPEDKKYREGSQTEGMTRRASPRAWLKPAASIAACGASPMAGGGAGGAGAGSISASKRVPGVKSGRVLWPGSSGRASGSSSRAQSAFSHRRWGHLHATLCNFYR